MYIYALCNVRGKLWLILFKNRDCLYSLFTLGSLFYTVSEWLLLNVNSAIFQLYNGENKLIFNEMMIRSALF